MSKNSLHKSQSQVIQGALSENCLQLIIEIHKSKHFNEDVAGDASMFRELINYIKVAALIW